MTTNHSLLKKNNRALLLRTIRSGEVSRAELARRTGLTRAAVTLLVDELIEDGLVVEGATARTPQGRHPTMLHLRSDAYFSLGVDISRDGVQLCIVDFTMQTVSEHFWSNTIGVEEVLDGIVDIAVEQAKTRRLLGVGVSAPGPVDVLRGEILQPAGLEAWHGFCVSTLERRLGLPLFFEKDTSALAIAEKSFIDQPSDNFLVLLADHGLGGGFIHRGRLFGSGEGFGCELGHISIDLHGEQCSCGNRGCAELYASVPRALEKARRYDATIDWPTLADRAMRGEQPYRDILCEQAAIFSTVCVGVVNLLEPELIVLEGALCAAYPLFKQQMERELSVRCFSRNGRGVRVVASCLPEHARAVAAASLVLENYFEGGNRQ